MHYDFFRTPLSKALHQTPTLCSTGCRVPFILYAYSVVWFFLHEKSVIFRLERINWSHKHAANTSNRSREHFPNRFEGTAQEQFRYCLVEKPLKDDFCRTYLSKSVNEALTHQMHTNEYLLHSA